MGMVVTKSQALEELYSVKSEKDVKRLSKLYVQTKDEILDIKAKNDLDAKEELVQLVSKNLATYLVSIGKDEFVLPDGSGVKVVERASSFWVLNKDDIPKNLPVKGKIKSLRSVFKKYFNDDKTKVQEAINSVTIRKIDSDKLDDYVRGLEFKNDKAKDAFFKELSMANVEFVQARYVLPIKPLSKKKK